MKKYKDIEVKQIKHEIIKVTCDRCGKILDEIGAYGEVTTTYKLKSRNAKKVKYFEVVTSHGDWGNDSGDSFRSQDVCENCMEFVFAEYMEDCKRSETQHVEVEQETGFVTE